MEDTICAVSTAPGAGGIAVIRVSGPKAIAICNTIFVPRTTGKDLLSQRAYTLRYGSIRHGEELIDEVLVALFRTPHSFTGEDTVEITCHGSVYIQQQRLVHRKSSLSFFYYGFSDSDIQIESITFAKVSSRSRSCVISRLIAA